MQEAVLFEPYAGCLGGTYIPVAAVFKVNNCAAHIAAIGVPHQTGNF